MLSTHSTMHCTPITLPHTPPRRTDSVSPIVRNYKYIYYGDILPHVEKFARQCIERAIVSTHNTPLIEQNAFPFISELFFHVKNLDAADRLQRSFPVGKSTSFFLKLSPLHGFSQCICVYSIGDQVLDDNVTIGHLLRHPKVASVDVPRPL